MRQAHAKDREDSDAGRHLQWIDENCSDSFPCDPTMLRNTGCCLTHLKVQLQFLCKCKSQLTEQEWRTCKFCCRPRATGGKSVHPCTRNRAQIKCCTQGLVALSQRSQLTPLIQKYAACPQHRWGGLCQLAWTPLMPLRKYRRRPFLFPHLHFILQRPVVLPFSHVIARNWHCADRLRYLPTFACDRKQHTWSSSA